ncbi:conjugative transposon protein TraM (plasmid) [Hymenobacter sp. NBH84]|uniref:conjugative transposon protein TraM n=1 Tax=Hymenobacter sp. NBH84 TaxID=2596915 RepID=UPI0016243B5F|nr:conjugative transposon protein TraM [Hymenobacter sp. NBH84]QNE42225.1 conjugative transposon protein TraM [Hymenobacter sp. NBH84]
MRKHSQEFIKKRQLMVFLPIPSVICLTLLFFLGGGGKGVPEATAAAGPGDTGINMSLPSAGKSALFENKMDAYKAPTDSTNRNGLAFTPVGEMEQPAAELPAPEAMGEAPDPAAGGLNYAVQSGQSPQRFDPNNDPNVVAVQSRMQHLQQQTYSAPAPPTPSSTRSAYPSGSVATSRDEEMDATLKELDQLKNQYQQRLLALNAPAAPAAAPAVAAPAPAASKPAKGMSAITQVPRSVVTNLSRSPGPPTASNGFHTVGETTAGIELNAVPAVVHNDQVVSQGSTVKLRLLTDVLLEGRMIPRNSFLYGVCNVSGNRLTIEATSVQYQNSLLPVSLRAFDIDGGEGLSIPGSAERDAAKQGMANGASSADLLTMSPSLAAQAAGIAVQTGKALAGKKIKLIKIHLKANYKLLLKS